MELWKKAAIGIGVPLGFFLLLTIAGLMYANLKKKTRGEVIDLEEGQGAKNTGAEAPKPKVIKWNPHG